MTRKEWEALVEYTLDLGRQMMECGAEAWRADNTMERILRAYGLTVLDTHSMATQTTVTVRLPEGEHYTSSRKIQPEKTGTDLGKLEIINGAARLICRDTPAVGALPLSLDHPSARWSWLELLGYLLGAGAFAVFFGGSLPDGLIAAAIAGVIYLIDQVRRVHQQNRTIYTMVACFLAGLLARGCSGLFPGIDLGMVVIGDIMLFIPGLALVNGVRELFYADILTGIYRMIEACLGAGAIAVGYAAALTIGGGVG